MVSAGPRLSKAGEHRFSERIEGLGVTEEGRDGDQEIAEQRLRFIPVLAQNFEIARQVARPRHLHPPSDSPQHRRTLVLGEVVSRAHPEVSSRTCRSRSSSAAGKSAIETDCLRRIKSGRRAAMSRTGRTKSTMPVAIALRGIEGCSASSGSWTKIIPPPSLTARTPSAPSEPAPLRMMAKPSPRRSDNERKNESIGDRRPRGSSNGTAESS